ncbi:U-box domain-containing protein 30-like isoform X1 [Benincasa hispida]|uniref:U-box domain-containing protein 30-like isoform X1 n=2 Tax=Benincasa hispida TaxID=102211 RepID=UPI0018FFAED1|nr:U-box domain-containing protein 30-like isoform X1 [Benincasa hispida]
MPMYQPSGRRREADSELGLGGGGQVLDVETAVKDGILGGGGGGGFICEGGITEKLDLKEIVEELENIEVPSVFICPISLEPMRDPVTLCTGQTYERSNILKWFSLGHITCPTTMQELWDDSITPNNTLHQLIYSWFSQKYLAMKKRSEDVQGRALELLDTLKKVKGQARVRALKDLRQVVGSNSAKNTVEDNGGVALISSLLGPFTSHAVGSEAIGILVNLDLDAESRRNLVQPAKISLMVDMLNEGSPETKINCTRLIETLLDGDDCGADTVSSFSLVVGLLRLIKEKKHPNGVLAGLRLLKALCSQEPVRNSVVSIGAIPQLIEILPNFDPECLELALHVLDSLSSLSEGRVALKDCPNTIPNLVKLLMRVSESCTQLALSILWAVCKLAPEECASQAVEAGLAAKLLLVIQSGCNPVLKQRSAELLKLCSLNYTATLFISKCKLTRTIQ